MENPPPQDVVFRPPKARNADGHSLTAFPLTPWQSHAGDLRWLNDYVGVPFRENGRDRTGWDCWGLLCAVYRERLAIELPDFRWPPPFGPLQRLRAFAGAVDQVATTAAAAELLGPEDWAIGLARAGNDPHHVGLSIGRGVLHARRDGTVWEPHARFELLNRGCRWFRWRR